MGRRLRYAAALAVLVLVAVWAWNRRVIGKFSVVLRNEHRLPRYVMLAYRNDQSRVDEIRPTFKQNAVGLSAKRGLIKKKDGNRVLFFKLGANESATVKFDRINSATMWSVPADGEAGDEKQLANRLHAPHATASQFEMTVHLYGDEVSYDKSFVNGITEDMAVAITNVEGGTDGEDPKPLPALQNWEDKLKRIPDWHTYVRKIDHFGATMYGIPSDGYREDGTTNMDCVRCPEKGGSGKDRIIREWSCRMYMYRHRTAYCSFIKEELGGYCWPYGEWECNDDRCGYPDTSPCELPENTPHKSSLSCPDCTTTEVNPTHKMAGATIAVTLYGIPPIAKVSEKPGATTYDADAIEKKFQEQQCNVDCH